MPERDLPMIEQQLEQARQNFDLNEIVEQHGLDAEDCGRLLDALLSEIEERGEITDDLLALLLLGFVCGLVLADA